MKTYSHIGGRPNYCKTETCKARRLQFRKIMNANLDYYIQQFLIMVEEQKFSMIEMD